MGNKYNTAYTIGNRLASKLPFGVNDRLNIMDAIIVLNDAGVVEVQSKLSPVYADEHVICEWQCVEDWVVNGGGRKITEQDVLELVAYVVSSNIDWR